MKHKIFVYGTLRKGYGNHGFIKNGTLLEEKHVLKGYKKIDLTRVVPAIVPDKDSEVEGEVYEIDDNTLENVRMLESGYIEGNKDGMLFYYMVEENTYVYNHIMRGWN